ncbi:MAG: OmpP1/FadL family transporter [Acidobacteriaceae bacterium]
MASMKRWAITAAMTAALAAPATAFATTAGYFMLGYSSKSDGLAGAGVALPEDAMAQAANPAGIVFVGSRFDVGAAAFVPERGYGQTNPNSAFPMTCAYCGSNSTFFIIPHVAVTYALDGDNAVGLAMYANGGMSTNYNTPSYATGIGYGYFNGGPYGAGGSGAPAGISAQTGVNFKQLFMQATYAYKFARHDSVGLGLLYVRQYFSDSGLAGFKPFSTVPRALSNNGVDMGTGFGVRLGTQLQLMRDLDFGLSYTPEIHMSRFQGYQGLFADHGNFNIPQNWTAGLAFKPVRNQVIAFDFERIYYNAIPSVGNLANGITSGARLGAENGPGFGWADISVYKLGYQIATSRTWTWRVGFAYNTEPVSPNQLLFNVLAPGVIQRDVTAGFTMHMAHGQDLTVAAMYGMPKKEYWNGDATTGVASFGSANYVYLREYQVDANWGIKF